MRTALIAGAVLLATAARAADDFSVEVVPGFVHLEPGQTATVKIVTSVVSGNPAPFELYVLRDANAGIGLALDLVDTHDPMDAVYGNIMTVPGQTRTWTIRAREDAAGGQQTFGITTARKGEPDRQFTGGTITLETTVLGQCPPGYHVEGSYCAPDVPVGCESAGAGFAFLGLPLLVLLRRRGSALKYVRHLAN